jgi:hypothetical protein
MFVRSLMVNFSLCLLKHYSLKTYWSLDVQLYGMKVSDEPHAHRAPGGTSSTGMRENPRASLDSVAKIIFTTAVNRNEVI